ncbi:PDR/VanB family oxidoreductase [Paraburkholderia sp. J63]|uniref:PDR/VanB family oxidoreductase n=1 Tax=Paraburkholderia sp. J63 TaxID=2805434 RepID=UPI002ABE0931|nr:PDR/VanB family oxidoreductase [Paraburkholderia sp. J63]
MQGELRTVRVARKTIEATDVCAFELVDPDGAALPPFAAGAHIDVHIAPDLVRQYSLCGDPDDRARYLIAVLRAPNGRGGSSAMHDAIHEGQEIRIGEPRNCFPLERETQPSLLLAGGIGVTPILCMAERLSRVGTGFEMHYLTRNRERTAFYERIAGSPFAASVTFHHDDGPAGQRLDIPALLERHKGRSQLYLCGPEGFLSFVRDTAREQGWPDKAVHFEYFSAAPASAGDDHEFVVELASTGQRLPVPPHQSVVEALAAHGIDIPVSCGQGVCGTCLTRVLAGEPDHRDYVLSAEEQARNDQFLPCCSRAKGELLVLDI